MVFTFENALEASILGEKVQKSFNGDDSTKADQWYGTMGRHTMLLGMKDNAKSFDKWMSQFDQYKDESTVLKAVAAGALVDILVKYLEDESAVQNRDYWQSPIETISEGRGDCEDFAILKYFVLRHLGVPAKDMYVIMVGRDGGDLDHAALLLRVGKKEDGSDDFIILTNSSKKNAGAPLEPETLKYKPYYAMNENGIWIFPANSDNEIKPRKAPACVPERDPKLRSAFDERMNAMVKTPPALKTLVRNEPRHPNRIR
ncbi:MAG: transglutaminase-like cysteine peptidase [Alphaproteobacteria bacterium]|nr:transglutaminase-like cysteine peptidase [Alphaproteobacteria bacterium]